MSTAEMTRFSAGGDDLTVFSAPAGRITDGQAMASSVDVNSVIRVAGHTFHFERRNGDYEEKTVAVDRPPGAGFVVMLNTLQYAFVRAGTNTLTERPLGELVARAGLRGNNIVCGVRLTDSNADDAVSISVNVTVLFFN